MAAEPPHTRARRDWSGRLRDRLWLIGPLAVFAVLRIPSFVEPHWYTDEAGYVTTARSLLQGKVLYSQIWTNKPPLQLWTVGVVTRLFGQSEATLHAVTFVSGLLTLGAVAYAGRRLFGKRRAAYALLIAAVLLGTPLLDAELLLPESLLIAPVTWAGALVITRAGNPDSRRWPLWPAAAGALAAVAVAYQQTALAEAFAFGLVLALVRPDGVSARRRVAMYAAAIGVLTAIWLIPALVTAGPANVAYALVGFYINFTQGRYGGGGQGIALEVLVPAAALALVVISAWVRRRRGDPVLGVWVWASAALLVPTLARQPYAHYLVPSVAPTALAVSSLARGWRSRAVLSWSTVRSPQIASAGLVAGTALAAWGASAAGVDWWPALGQNVHSVADYYGGAGAIVEGGQALEAWQDMFDARISADRQMGAWIHTHDLDGSSAVVWSADSWLYATNDLQLLLPTPPIYNAEVLLTSDIHVGQVVADLDPDLVITEESARTALPSINAVLAANYQAMTESGEEIVWLRDDLVPSLMIPSLSP